MLLCRLFLVRLIFASLLSLSQKSGTARPVSKAGIVHLVGDVHRPMGVDGLRCHFSPITVDGSFRNSWTTS